MTGELHIEEHKNDLKQAAGEKQASNAKLVEDFIKDLKIAGKEDKKNSKTEKLTPTERAKMNEFIKSSPAIIDGISKNLSENLEKIGKTEIDFFIKAKGAFDEDVKIFKTKYPEKANDFKPLETSLTSIQKRIDLKQIEVIQGYVDKFNKTELESFKGLIKEKNTDGTDNTTYKIITDRIQIIEKNDTKNAEAELNKNRTAETAKKFFETNDKNNFNIAFDEITKLTTINIESYINIEDKEAASKVKNFVKLIKTYTQDETIKNISLIVAGAQDSTYPQGTKIIRFNQTIKDEKQVEKTVSKDIIFGSQDEAQGIKAEKFDISKVDISIENPLAQFDGKGNYKSLQKYIKANPDKIATNFKNIADAILVYQNKSTDKKTIAETADMYEDINALKNGYANVMTDYIITHTEILDTYCSYLTTDNMNILGADKATRIANFNKLATNQSFLNAVKTLKLEQQILDLRTSIAEEKKTSLKEGLKSLGNAMVSLLMMFGIGKGKLKSRLPPSMRKDIDDAYGKEFALEKTEKDAIVEMRDKLAEKEENKTEERKYNKQDYRTPNASEIQKKNIIKTDNIEEENYKFIDPKIIRKGIEIYKNENKNTKINESDIIISKNNKEEPNLTRILQNDNNKKIFKDIMTYIINNDETRKTIAETNNKIRTLGVAKKDKVDMPYSEYFTDYNQRIGSLIKSKTDIGVYLMSYLFTGSKDLGYTITENNLVNGTTIPDRTEIPQTAKEYIVGSEGAILRNDTGGEIPKGTLAKETVVIEVKGEDLKSAKELGITTLTGVADPTTYKFRKVTASIDGKDVIGRIPETAATEKTESTPRETEEKLIIEEKYGNKSGETYTLTDAVKLIKIQDLFTNKSITTRPQTLKFTPIKTGKEITVNLGKDPKDMKTDTYVYNGARVQIHPGDKLSLPEKSNTTETQEQKLLSEKIRNIDIEIKKIGKDNLYEGFNTANYVYTESPSAEQKVYQDKILTLIKELTEIQCDVKKINDKYLSQYPELINFNYKSTGTLKDYIPHIKNMLIMMGGKENKYNDITKNMIEGTTYTAGSNKWEINIKDKTAKTMGKLLFGYTENTDKTRILTPKWTPEPTSNA